MNSNIITPIPKVHDVVVIKDFRPIAIANFGFKVISKILDDRLGIVCSMVICHNQNGFIKGRKIKDCMCIAYELLNMVSKNIRVVMLLLRLIFL